MKKTLLKPILCGLSVCLIAATSFAQETKKTDTDQTSTREAGKSKQFCSSKDIVGANVKDSAAQKVGDVSEIYVNPKTGEAFAAIDITGRRHAVVPLQALTFSPPRGILHNAEATIGKTKAELESGPTISNHEWQRLDDASFTQTVYSFYNVRQPASGTVAPTGRTSEPSKPQPQPQTQP